MRNSPITVVEFCAGYGGLGLGVKRVLGDQLLTIGYCELEGFAQANLISKMEAGLLDAAPLWPNLYQFPYARFRGLVDIVLAGIPCQPHSHAGKRGGGGDERFLFDDWLNGLSLMEPGLILIENVEGLLSSKMPDGSLCIDYVVTRLESLGYRVEGGIFSASEVGAPHQRKRVFILAHRNGWGREISNWGKFTSQPLPECDGSTRGAVAHHHHQRLQGLRECGGSEGRQESTGHAGSSNQVRSASMGNTPSDDQQRDRESSEGGRPEIPFGRSSAWPSGPGEPQHAWEPPRTVENTQCSQWGTVALAGINDTNGEEAGRKQGASGLGDSSEMGDTPRVHGGGGTGELRRGRGVCETGEAGGVEGLAQPPSGASGESQTRHGRESIGGGGGGGTEVVNPTSPRRNRPVGRTEGETWNETRVPVSGAGCEDNELDNTQSDGRLGHAGDPATESGGDGPDDGLSGASSETGWPEFPTCFVCAKSIYWDAPRGCGCELSVANCCDQCGVRVEECQCELANTERPLETGRVAGCGEEGSRGPHDQFGGPTAQDGQAEQPVGLPSYGRADGVGLAELSGLSDTELAEIYQWMEQTDNRVDELRMLGNGVVISTVEVAFRTLLARFL